MRGIGYRGGASAAVFGVSGRASGFLLVAAVLLCAHPVSAVAADNTASALEAAGWSESSPGLLMSLPSRTADIRESGIGGDFVLAPGTALLWERRFRDASGSGTSLEIEMYSDGANVSSEDYRKKRASFPVSVTAVFGRDSLDLPPGRRVLNLFVSIWRAFRPGGIRLTYAAGNVAPAGSMYRKSDDETVFILAGDDDRGKRIAARRDLAADFRAAYGRDPRGPVTRLVVRAGRPSREKETIKAGIRLAFPGKR